MIKMIIAMLYTLLVVETPPTKGDIQNGLDDGQPLVECECD